jgi:hypothetical protein
MNEKVLTRAVVRAHCYGGDERVLEQMRVTPSRRASGTTRTRSSALAPGPTAGAVPAHSAVAIC